MNALLHIVHDAGLSDILTAGPEHVEYGRLFDVGTSVVVDPVDRSVTAQARRLAGQSDGRLKLAVSESAASGLGVALEARAQHAAVLLLLLPPVTASEPWIGLLIAAGPGLPIMGLLGRRGCDVLVPTVRTVLGEPQLGSIFTEPDAEFTAESEQRLLTRMRQLYGE